MTAFTLTQPLRDALVELGRIHAPQECIGIGLGAAPGVVAEFHPVPNVHEHPVTRYEVSAADQLRLHMRAEELGWQTTLVFHSHPATEPYPSPTDIALAAWPDAIYAILGLGTPEPELRAYRIVDRVVTELPVIVTAAGA